MLNNIIHINYDITIKRFAFVLLLCLYAPVIWSQEATPDSLRTGFDLGNLKFPNPDSIESKYTYDPITDRYIFTEKVGSFDINYPIILTPKQYDILIARESLRNYYREKIDAFDGKKEGSEEAQKNLLPEFYIKSGLFKTIFGGNTIEVIPQGSVEMDLGILFSKQDNPLLSPRNRTNFSFDFDQRISLSLIGKVGTRLQITANYDTQATFGFQELFKLEFDPTVGGGEDSIIQKIELGNVNMPLNTSLITGAQSLFGVKAQLQFGRTTFTGVFSEQKSQARSVTVQGGGTVEEFELFIRDYDENRHFFLAQYFRDTYESSLQNYPFLRNDGLQIKRIEVWVTNRSNRTENVRNVVALQDLAEESRLANTSVTINSTGFTLNSGGMAYPTNQNNGLDPTNIGEIGSQLTEQIRDISTVKNGFAFPNEPKEGIDYAKLENARKLTEGQEYTLNEQLGYISLNQRLNNDEVLAVAYQYIVGENVFQVGEFANDGLEATNVETNDQGQVNVVNSTLVLKMLKSSLTVVDNPVWDLMMKNIYDTGAYNLAQDDFTLNIFYNEASPLNFITPVEGTTFPLFDNNTIITNDDTEIAETPLLRLFNLDKLNFNNDPQARGDGFFDFIPGITVVPENGKIIFTSVEPFGKYLFDLLGGGDYEADVYTNENQEKYVYDLLYKSTKTAALEEVEKNKFKLQGRYKSTSGGDGIPIGAFNVPRGSVRVTAGGRTLVEGVDYTVNYQLGRVQILDESLKASNTPIDISTENNNLFGQQTRRFTGFNVEHKFSEDFILGATLLNLNERPITQKANFGSESINNTILGVNGNYSTEAPLLTRLVNKLPNIDTDVESKLSLRGEFAYLAPGAPKGTDLNGEATSYIDDFEGSQNGIDLKAATSWFLSSRPEQLGFNHTFVIKNDDSEIIKVEDDAGIQNGYGRALLNWYSLDPVFFSNQRPNGISDDDLSGLYNSRVFIEELFNQDLVQGQNTVLNTLDLAYYPQERGPYNFDEKTLDGITAEEAKANSWAGITRQITSTDFEQQNVEYIEFWLQDPFQENPTNPGGKLVFNLGNISEDIIKDEKKLFENGLPTNGDLSTLTTTEGWGTVVPQNQSLIYAFDSTGAERTNQDVGYDGYGDSSEAPILPPDSTDPDKQLEINELNRIYAQFKTAFPEDPSNDNYSYFLNTGGNIFERYSRYNGVDGNSPDTFSDTNRAGNTQPDVEDINRDNTMNTINSYYEYELDLQPNYLPKSLSDLSIPTGTPAIDSLRSYIADFKVTKRNMPNGQTADVNWYQFRIPVGASGPRKAIGEITDMRSIRFARIYLKEFQETTFLRFGTLDLVRSDWRRYEQTLNDNITSINNTDFSLGIKGTIDNQDSYLSPPNIEPEELFNSNTVVAQNEQALVLNVCNLVKEDSRAAFKNINLDMRQYERVRMFIHAGASQSGTELLSDSDLVGFIRMGNDLTDNYYQIEVPLKVSESLTREGLWPSENEINLPLSILGQIKAKGISDGTLSNLDATYYDVVNGGVVPVSNPFGGYVIGQQRVAIKGNPNYGDIRTLMVGVKNVSSSSKCGEVWFNELRLAGLDNEGGWAAIASMDANIADFANISAAGRRSTAGFGSLEQGPSERSLEDVQQYDFVTNVNIGQLLPKKWGVQLPFNYGQGEELITPKFDQSYQDLTLESRLDAATSEQEKTEIKEQSESYTRRQSINFIGVRKNRTGESVPRFYDVENFTLNYSYNKVQHRDFEIENAVNKTLRVGANYAHNFNPITVKPFANNDSIFMNKHWKLLKEFNFNLLPTNFTVSSDVNRQFNKQKFRAFLGEGSIGVEELFRRNYTQDFQYTVNHNLTESIQLNFNVTNNNIVRNYFRDNDRVAGIQDPTLDVWDGLLDPGDPNRKTQNFGLTYQLPFDKFPALSFVNSTYQYNGGFQWQKGSDILANLGNTIQNSNVHNLNTSVDMSRFYKSIGLVRKSKRRRAKTPPNPQPTKGDSDKKKKKSKKAPKAKSKTAIKIYNAGVDLLTTVKRIQVNYSENNGTFLPGYLPTPGFLGASRPTVGYAFGSQRRITDLAARRGWLSADDQLNQQYTTSNTTQLGITASLQPAKDLKIELIGNRAYNENSSESFQIVDVDNNGINEYKPLIPNITGNFNISTVLLATAFSKSDEVQSKAFETFKSNREVVAHRLARDFYGTDAYERDPDNPAYPLGFGKNSQRVLLPAFMAAYTGTDAQKVKTSAFRDIPIPNWDLKYSGFMKFKWFKKNFKRFSLTHGYRSTYTINQFTTNLDYTAPSLGQPYANQTEGVLDQAGNFKNQQLLGGITISEMFSPLFRLDFEMKNSIKILTEMRKDRMLSLSFDNQLFTEVSGNEYVVGLGYRIKDLSIKSKLAGPKKRIVSDLNMKADVSVRENKTIVRYLDLDNNQITSGQTIWGINYSADYAFSKSLTAIFYFDYTFSKYAISTAFPLTTIRSGLTVRYNLGN